MKGEEFLNDGQCFSTQSTEARHYLQKWARCTKKDKTYIYLQSAHLYLEHLGKN